MPICRLRGRHSHAARARLVWPDMLEEPADLFVLLCRAHERLDRELARILVFLNQGDSVAASPRVRDFAVELRLHLAAEDGILVPYFAGARGAGPDDPVAIMLREHRDILSQLALLEDTLNASTPDVGEAGIYAAILSGTLAKHEYREEHNLFPRWRVVLKAAPEAERAKLAARVAAGLEIRQD